MESKKGISPILLCLLVLVGSCLVGTGIWYALNYFKGNETTPEELDDDTAALINELKDIFYFDNSSVVNIPLYPSKEKVYENYEKMSKKIENVSVDYECVKYSKVKFEYNDGHQEEKNMCSTSKIIINDETAFYYNVDYSLDNIVEGLVLWGWDVVETISEKDKDIKNKIFVNDSNLLYYDDFFIDTHHWCCGLDTSTLIVYNKTGDKVFEINKLIRTVYGNLYQLEPTVKDSKLYYIVNDDGVCKLNYVDLTSNKLNSTFIKVLSNQDCSQDK